MANPYLVQPVSIGSGLAGLGQSLMQAGQIKQQREQELSQQQRLEAADLELQETMAELETAMQNKDYDTINRISLRYPDRAKLATQALNDEQKRERQNVINVGFEFLQNPKDYERILRENPKFAASVGGYEEAMKDMQEDPQGIQEQVSALLAWEGGDQWKQFREYQKSVSDGDQQPKTQRQKEWDQYISLKETDPEGALQFGRAAGFVSKEGKETKPTKTANAQDWETYKQLKKTNPDEAEQFGRKVGFVSKEGLELSAGLQKRLSTATDEAIDSERAANSAETLADDFERMNVSGGLLAGKWSESLKDITGAQDAVTELRRRYNAVRSSQAVKNLPPGVASDKDIELALSGFPSENANAAQVASFMRGVAKMERERAKYASFRADYISENGTERGMLKAWKEQQNASDTNTVNWADL